MGVLVAPSVPGYTPRSGFDHVRCAGAPHRTGHTPRTRFACARPFRFAKGAGISCSI